jgi:hypothetical protein
MYGVKAGDHLMTGRTFYTHHGIAVSTDRVIHYAGKNGLFGDGLITEVSLADFVGDDELSVVEHPSPRHDIEDSVTRARQRLGETTYNLVFNNCEHFVTWCIEGVVSSEQVNSKVDQIGLVAETAAMYRWYESAKTWCTPFGRRRPSARSRKR